MLASCDSDFSSPISEHMFHIKFKFVSTSSWSCEISCRWMPQNTFDHIIISIFRLGCCSCPIQWGWWWINTGSDNGLVLPSGNKPIPQSVLTSTFLCNNELNSWQLEVTVSEVAPTVQIYGMLSTCPAVHMSQLITHYPTQIEPGDEHLLCTHTVGKQ